MENLKYEYLAMRREMALGYGQHSFEEGETITELRGKCITILKEKCTSRTGFFIDSELKKSVERIIDIDEVSRADKSRVSIVIKQLNRLSYEKLLAVHITLRIYT